jgi:hypothetical protein
MVTFLTKKGMKIRFSSISEKIVKGWEGYKGIMLDRERDFFIYTLYTKRLQEEI